MHFLKDVLVAVASLDLKVPFARLKFITVAEGCIRPTHSNRRLSYLTGSNIR